MPDSYEDVQFEKDAVDNIIELCRSVKDQNVRQIILGLDFFTNYEGELRKLEKNLRTAPIHREKMFNRILNLAFAYVISKYASLNMRATSNCEARIKHAIEHLYSTYNVTDDVIRFVILNVALGLDANKEFTKKFEVISSSEDFFNNTSEYINIFKHVQKLRQSTFKSKNKITGSNDYLYMLFKKVSFICDLEIVDSSEYADPESMLAPCAFKTGKKIFPSKYTLVKYSPNAYVKKFLLLRAIDDFKVKAGGNPWLRLSYTEMSEHDTCENIKVFVTQKLNERDDRGLQILMPSVGMFYSYITGDLLRKRHRMSFCNGLSSYKYYGELAASVMDALEILVVSNDKQYSVVENYILPVIKNNFNICKDDCVCTGVGCKFGAKQRLCNKDKVIELKNDLTADCLINMDTVSILTILFSVVGCKEILPQIFAKFKFDTAQSYDELFSKVNEQLDKRFSEFDSDKVEELRKQFYKKSIDYLSLNLDDFKRNNPLVAKTLKPFKIRAYTDALIASLENLDRDKSDCNVNPSEDVYSIQSKIDLINGISDVVDVRRALKETLKVIVTYYSGLANCTQQQLDYEIKAERIATLNEKTVRECEKAIQTAFMDGVRMKKKVLGDNPDFYTLFKNLVDDTEELKSEISIMLGREIVNLNRLRRFISLDDDNKKCKLIERRRRDNGVFEVIYECDLDNETECSFDKPKFVSKVVELLGFFKGSDGGFACYPQVLTHTSSRVNVDNTTINAFTVYESEQYIPQKEYNVITYFNYEISKRYFYIAPKKFEKTRWITYPILIRCSEFFNEVIKEKADEQNLS